MWLINKIIGVEDKGDYFLVDLLHEITVMYLDKSGRYVFDRRKQIDVKKVDLRHLGVEKYIEVGKEIEIDDTTSGDFFILDFNLRRPQEEVFREKLESASKKITELEKKLEYEKESHQAVLPFQFNHYRNQKLLVEVFAELEERIGKENVTVDNWLPRLFQLLLWKAQKAKNEKQEVEKQKRGQERKKDKIHSKYKQKIRRIKKLVGQNTYWTDQDNKLRANIKDLQLETNSQKVEIQQKNGRINSLESDLKQQEEQNQKIAELEQELNTKKSDYISLNDLYQQVQEKNRKIKEGSRKQEQKIKKQKTTIKKLKQAQENWQQHEKQLLAEIELLKKPPLTNSNKENIKQNTVIKEIIKEVIIKNLENKELGLNLSSQEKTKLNNLPLQEVENYQQQLIKNKFNHLESQIKQLTNNSNTIERERERQKFSFSDYWLVC